MTDEPTRADADSKDDEQRQLFWEAAANAFRPYAGWAFYGFGALLVLIGWLGISGESVVAKQLPYLISGGIGGILLAVLGAYFLGIEELRKDSGRLDRMEKQVEQLHRLLLAHPDAPAIEDVAGGTTDTTAVHAPSANGHVLIVESGESFHRSGCALVAGKHATELAPAVAVGRGLHPCPVCEPAPT